MGDRIQNVSLPKIGEKSLFTKDLEEALTNGGVDFVVHSLKDLPTSLPTGMAIGAVLKRGDPRDALILNEQHKGSTLATLPPGSVIGTSSLRRTAQLMRKYPHLVVCDIRGNLNTRLAKLDAPTSKYSGLVLAQVGVERMGWKDRIDQVLEPDDVMMFAVGQGALAVECRANDPYILDMLEDITSFATECEIVAERSFLKTLGGGCSAPVAVATQFHKLCENINQHQLTIKGGVWSLDGKDELLDEVSATFNSLDKLKRFSTSDSDYVEPPAKRTRTTSVIDESSIEWFDAASGEKTKISLESILKKHGGKCPFPTKSEAVSHLSEMPLRVNQIKATLCPVTGQGTSSQVTSCPLELHVGQDVMGECPVLNTDEKVLLGGDIIAKAATTAVELDGHLSTAGGGATTAPDVTAKCPFANKRSTASLSVFPTMLQVVGADACPFMTSIKLIDCDENLNQTETINNYQFNIDDKIRLYCGLVCHPSMDENVLVKCEQLGEELANKLIAKGALKVMKIAQNIIHSNS